MKGNMQRVPFVDLPMMYPKQWILLVNLQKEPTRHCSSGEVYWVSEQKDEIHAERRRLGDAMGRTMIVEGFDDTPRIGGLLW